MEKHLLLGECGNFTVEVIPFRSDRFLQLSAQPVGLRACCRQELRPLTLRRIRGLKEKPGALLVKVLVLLLENPPAPSGRRPSAFSAS